MKREAEEDLGWGAPARPISGLNPQNFALVLPISAPLHCTRFRDHIVSDGPANTRAGAAFHPGVLAAPLPGGFAEAVSEPGPWAVFTILLLEPD